MQGSGNLSAWTFTIRRVVPRRNHELNREHSQFMTDIASIRLSCDFLDKMMIKNVTFSQNIRPHFSVSGFETILSETADAPSIIKAYQVQVLT